MPSIKIWDTDFEVLDKIAEVNDMDIADVVEMLVDYVEEMKKDNGLN